MLRTRLMPATMSKVSVDKWNVMFSTGWEIQVDGSKPTLFWPGISGEGLKPGRS